MNNYLFKSGSVEQWKDNMRDFAKASRIVLLIKQRVPKAWVTEVWAAEVPPYTILNNKNNPTIQLVIDVRFNELNIILYNLIHYSGKETIFNEIIPNEAADEDFIRDIVDSFVHYAIGTKQLSVQEWFDQKMGV